MLSQFSFPDKMFLYYLNPQKLSPLPFQNCVSGPLQSVIWLCVCDICLRTSVQRILQWEQCQQGWLGVFALPQWDHIRLWWGMRKKLLFCSSQFQTHSLFVSASHPLLLIVVSVMQLLSKPKFSSVEKIKTIGSTYMAAAGLTQSPLGDESKVFLASHKCQCFHPFLKSSSHHVLKACPILLPDIGMISGSPCRKLRCPTRMCAAWWSLPLLWWANWSSSTHTLLIALNSGSVSFRIGKVRCLNLDLYSCACIAVI